MLKLLENNNSEMNMKIIFISCSSDADFVEDINSFAFRNHHAEFSKQM